MSCSRNIQATPRNLPWAYLGLFFRNMQILGNGARINIIIVYCETTGQARHMQTMGYITLFILFVFFVLCSVICFYSLCAAKTDGKKKKWPRHPIYWAETLDLSCCPRLEIQSHFTQWCLLSSFPLAQFPWSRWLSSCLGKLCLKHCIGKASSVYPGTFVHF